MGRSSFAAGGFSSGFAARPWENQPPRDADSPPVLRDTASPPPGGRPYSPASSPEPPLTAKALALDDLPRPGGKSAMYRDAYESGTEDPRTDCEHTEVPSDDDDGASSRGASRGAPPRGAPPRLSIDERRRRSKSGEDDYASALGQWSSGNDQYGYEEGSPGGSSYSYERPGRFGAYGEEKRPESRDEPRNHYFGRGGFDEPRPPTPTPPAGGERSPVHPGRGGAVTADGGHLTGFDRAASGAPPTKLNVRAWTTSDAVVLQDVPSVLVVGFSDGVDFTLQTNVTAAAVALEIMSSPDYLGAQVVFWDGAPLAHDSFTSVLPALAARGCRLAAWRDATDDSQKARLCDSWAGVDAAEAVVALFDDQSPRAAGAVGGFDAPDDVAPAARNNLRLLSFTNVKSVVCFGGGKDVLDMVAHAPKDVSFHVVPAVRCADNGADGQFGTDDDLFEDAHILAYDGANADRVHVYQLYG